MVETKACRIFRHALVVGVGNRIQGSELRRYRLHGLPRCLRRWVVHSYFLGVEVPGGIVVLIDYLHMDDKIVTREVRVYTIHDVAVRWQRLDPLFILVFLCSVVCEADPQFFDGCASRKHEFYRCAGVVLIRVLSVNFTTDRLNKRHIRCRV